MALNGLYILLYLYILPGDVLAGPTWDRGHPALVFRRPVGLFGCGIHKMCMDQHL